MSVKIGMTGSRDGISEYAISKFKDYLDTLSVKVDEVHHGDCVGADTIFHDICKSKGFRIVVHPPTNPTMRSYCDGDVIKPPLAYLERNKRIVDETDFIVAFPSSTNEVVRSGTWSTIRYARKKGKNVVMFPPYAHE